LQKEQLVTEEPMKGKTMDIKKNITKNKKRVAWNKGLTKNTSETVRRYGEKISISHNKNHKLNGHKAWNKGLKKETNSSVKSISTHLLGHTPSNKGVFSIDNRAKLFKLYWDDLMTNEEIAELCNVSGATVARALRRFDIPLKTASERTKWANCGGRPKLNGYWIYDGLYEHRSVYEKFYNCKLKSNEIIHHKDFDITNNHYLNLTKVNASEHGLIHKRMKQPITIPMYEVYLRMAELISNRSTCIRLKTGAVIASSDLSKVYAIGYNGNIHGGVNSCNGISGECGCIHSEENALLKVTSDDKNKVLFCTHSPCKNCAKKIIQAGFSDVFYRNEYRDTKPIKFLHFYGVRTCHYILWKNKYQEEKH
jgi:dCMP deaminase